MTKATQKRKHSIRACLDLEGGARQPAGTGAIAESSHLFDPNTSRLKIFKEKKMG